MEIRMLVGLAGNEYSLSPGDQRDFPDAEAIRLVEAGYAVPVGEKEVERAVSQPAPERRTKKGRANVVRADDNDSTDD